MYRKTYVNINTTILENNIKNIRENYPDYKYYIGVVKNDAYHHGIDVIPSLIAGGINYLAVSSLDEAMEIRNKFKEIPILVLEPINIEFMSIALKNKITITVDSLDYLVALEKEKISGNLKIHLKIDSGMNRLGFKDKKELEEAYNLVENNDNLFLEGIYTHFATSGRGDIFYYEQLRKLNDLIDFMEIERIPIIHFDRSLTFVSHEKIPKANGIRLGIMMYGFSGSAVLNKNFKNWLRKLKRNLLGKSEANNYISQNNLNLKTAFSLYSEVISLRRVRVGEKVGYNASYEVLNDGFIATIAIGYADGVTKDYNFVYINNKPYEIVSDSMDMLMVLVDDSVKVGDTVEVIGDNNTIQMVARRLNTNGYHVFNNITPRVPRVYLDKKKGK